MDILEVIRTRILQDFPDITEDELSLRLSIAIDLLESIRN